MRIDGFGSLPGIANRPAIERPAARAESPADLKAGLSVDELNYFAELERLGPVTYGRRGAKVDTTPSPAALGQRVDVRA